MKIELIGKLLSTAAIAVTIAALVQAASTLERC